MDINQLYAQAVAARKNGNLLEAEQLYSTILAQAPIPEVLVNHGNVLTAMGRPGEALAAYDQALAARPDFFEALFNRANLLLETRRTEEALAGFEKAVAARPDAAPVWLEPCTCTTGQARLRLRAGIWYCTYIWRMVIWLGCAPVGVGDAAYRVTLGTPPM